ncbi:MAG: AAA family ATPase [Promethearchaeota archaeon]
MELIFIIGPPAVGKMTVGRELSKITGYKLLHNHMTIDLVIQFFDFGTIKFNKLNEEFRRRIFEEVASSDLKGLIFTVVIAMNLLTDKIYLENLAAIFLEQGASIYYVELEAELSERLKRNKGQSRLIAKPQSKKNVEKTEKRLLEWEKKFIMNSSEKTPFFFDVNYLKIENTNVSADEAAIRIKKHYNL